MIPLGTEGSAVVSHSLWQRWRTVRHSVLLPVSCTVLAGKQLPGQPKQSWSQGWLASLKLCEVAMRATHSSGILRGCTPSPPQFPSFTKWFRVMPRLSRMSSQMGGARVPESPTLRLGAGKWRAFNRSSLPVAIVM